MRYREFGNTGMKTSETGFGAWAIGGDAMIGETAIGWGPADDALSVKAIHAALDAGINFFDTADIYGLGHSESLLGKTLQGNREVLIASKAGNVARDGQFTVDYSGSHIIRACEDSLRRLKRDHIDFYQLHTARVVHLEQGDCIKAMQTLQQQGKIRYWGLSLNTFEPATEAELMMDKQLGNGFQLVLNILNQQTIPLIRAAQEKGYGIIARMPLQFGLLTGKFDTNSSFAETDHRKNRVRPELVTAVHNALIPVWELCEKYQCTRAQLAIRYVLSYPGVSVVIPGIRTPEQVRDNTGADFLLEEADMKMIEDLGREKLNGILDMIRKLG